jgi:antitoxin component YwqK of YwqJK toxin-antitoxin module
MKQLSIFLLLCSLGFSQYNTPINFELLKERDGLYYQYNSPKPFSGKVFNIEGLSEGSFRNGKKSGKFSFYFDNGQLKSQGYYSNNLQQRKWTYYYENGQLNGIGSYKDSDGTDLGDSGVPRHGRTGKWKFYYENGQLRDEITYKNGGYIGPFKSYFENGQTEWEFYYNTDGTRDGTQKTKRWYENGQLWYEGYVVRVDDEDEWNGPYKSYYEDGQLEQEVSFKDGKNDGPFKSYFENGQPEWEYYYNTDGTRDGTQKTKRWYENGQLWYEGYWITIDEEGVWNGPYKSYYEDGQLESEKTYKDGELIDSQEY